ncbi:MAG: uracil phosphoribosyltransferase [Bacteroidetes bacterium]|nr:uracil phosphoribosyltransferase [Bacteroidota bacterium]
MKRPKHLELIEHPLVELYISKLRDVNSDISTFRSAMDRLGGILAYHALQRVQGEEIKVTTPLETTNGLKINEPVHVIPILRAGLSLVQGLLHFIPDARVGHIGVYRDHSSHEPVNYYDNLPEDIDRGLSIVVDPMLATGGSASHALHYLKENGAKNIVFACVIAAPEGVEKVHDQHPDITIISTKLDRELNDQAYILPGLGDAGDRYFGT